MTFLISLDAALSLKSLGDRDAIKQVFLITLDNALKHSSSDVNVTAKQEGTAIEIHVQDLGEGISPEKLSHVFDRFYRGEEDTVMPGFGLGLSIAKALVDGMDGEIDMESEPGKGCTVKIRFQSVRQG